MTGPPPSRLQRGLLALVRGQGATLTGLLDQRSLLELEYVKAEAKAPNSREPSREEIAETARQLIEQATYALDRPLSQRQHVDADLGMAARVLLALEPGTYALSLHERRRRAAGYLGIR